MTTLAEALASKGQMAADLAAGINTLDLDASVTFTKYVKAVLPLDGFVFWVKADIISPSALLSAARLNAVAFNASPRVVTPAPTISVKGSLHYTIDKQQNEDETASKNSVIFTALSEVNDLEQVGPNVMFIARLGTDKSPYAFSQRGRYYEAADLRHYVGDALNPAFFTQVVDDPTTFDMRRLVVSNSLPIWLALNTYVPPYPGFVSNVTLYPSFAVPDNLPAPYGVVHIEPGETRSLQSAPHYGPTYSHYQAVRENVRVTLYGLDNDAAMTFLDTVYQYSYDYSAIGLCNMPLIKDEKRTQRELNILAMKKTIDFEVNYTQVAARQIARQLIETCIQTYLPRDAIFAA